VHPLCFVKLGGSLITDKRREATPRWHVLRRLADELSEARRANPALRVVCGHGSGSFGHWEASQYGTHAGVRSPEEWYGFTKVSAAALKLNRIVTGTFVAAGVPMLSLQPSASAVACDGAITALDLEPVRLALAHGIVPLVFGDVAFDQVRGGTIISTEHIFFYLAETLRPSWIFLLGNAHGVLDGTGDVIPLITPGTYPEFQGHLRRSGYTDVTGGMADKVAQMVDLVGRQPELMVRIFTGMTPGLLTNALRDPARFSSGTLIRADLGSEPRSPSTPEI
jgi:isopentenyl phosphate kinase